MAAHRLCHTLSSEFSHALLRTAGSLFCRRKPPASTGGHDTPPDDTHEKAAEHAIAIMPSQPQIQQQICLSLTLRESPASPRA
eukprot:6229123-Prymnesium_polylepis.2